MKGKRFTRVISLMLTVTMLLGMVPTALAGGGGDNQTGKPSDEQGDNLRGVPGYSGYYGSFTRFTLVKFNFSDRQTGPIAASTWNNYEVLGSVDVVGTQKGNINPNNVANGVTTSYKTNALDYRYETDIAAYMNSRKQSSWSPIVRDWLPDFVYGDNTAMRDAILELFGDHVRDIGDRHFYSMEDHATKRERFDDILDNMGQDPGNKVTSDVFLKEDGSCCYRLLAEPGVVCEINYNKVAMTLRDMMGWSKYIFGEVWQQSGTVTTCPFWYQWYHRAKNLAFGMYLGSSELTTYDWSNTGELKEEKLKVYEIGNHDTANGVFQGVVDSYKAGALSTSSSQYGYFREHIFGGTGTGYGPGDNNYVAGDYVGYGLGIIAPYNYAPNMATDPVLTISKSVGGNLADPTKYFGFEIKLNVPDGVTVKSYRTYASGTVGTKEIQLLRDNTDSDSDKYNKIVKFEVPNSSGSGMHDENLGLIDNTNFSLIFEGLADGQTVAYSVKELSANQNGYVTSINGAETADGKVESDIRTLKNLTYVNTKEGVQFKKEVGAKGDGSKAYPAGTEFEFNVYGTYGEYGETAGQIDFPVYYTKYDATGKEITGSSGKWNELSVDTALTHTFTLKDGETFEITGLRYDKYSNVQVSESKYKEPGKEWQDINQANVSTYLVNDGVKEAGSDIAGLNYRTVTVGKVDVKVVCVFNNGAPTGDKAHVLIDYNLPGAAATDGDTTTPITASTVVDCGSHIVSDQVPLMSYISTATYSGTLGPNQEGLVVAGRG